MCVEDAPPSLLYPAAFMNKIFSSLLAAAALTAWAQPAPAQELVSTGTIHEIKPETGALVMRSDQTKGLVVFEGANRSNIFRTDGVAARLEELSPGAKVTVKYAMRGNQWYISSVMLGPDSAPAPTPQRGYPVNNDPAAYAPAYRDSDITTRPGSAAAIDNDRTTVPANSAAMDGDITTIPASRGTTPLRRTQP